MSPPPTPPPPAGDEVASGPSPSLNGVVLPPASPPADNLPVPSQSARSASVTTSHPSDGDFDPSHPSAADDSPHQQKKNVAKKGKKKRLTELGRKRKETKDRKAKERKLQEKVDARTKKWREENRMRAEKVVSAGKPIFEKLFREVVQRYDRNALHEFRASLFAKDSTTCSEDVDVAERRWLADTNKRRKDFHKWVDSRLDVDGPG